MRIIDSFIDKVADRLLLKSSGGWASLWASAREHLLFRHKVTQPYKETTNVYKAVKAIADNIPQAQLKFYDWQTDKEVYPSDLSRLFARPEMRRTYNSWMQCAAGFYSLYGEVFFYKRPSLGQSLGTSRLPSELQILNPSSVSEVVDSRTGELTAWRVGQMTYPTDLIVPVLDFNPYNPHRGMSAIDPLTNEIAVDFASMLYNKKFFENDGSPSVMLMTDKSLTEEQRKRLLENWEKRHRGVANSNRPTVLEGGLKAEPFISSHKDMDFIEQKKYMREEILGTYRSPKALFNITETLNYATFTGQMKIFWVYTLVPILRKFEDALNVNVINQINPNVYLRFDLRNVPAFQEDFQHKVETASKLFAMGVPLNAINEKMELGFDKFAWGDEWWVTYGMVPASEATMDIGADHQQDPAPAKAAQAAVKDATTLRKLAIWKGWLSKQGAVERAFERKVRRYFYEQRTAALKVVSANTPDIMLEWESEEKKIKDISRPYFEAAMKHGLDFAAGLVGSKKSIEDDILAGEVAAAVQVRCDRIAGIARTVRKQLQKTLGEGVAAGDSIQMLAGRIKDVYNMASARSKLIARTETAGAVNGASDMYYDHVGIEQKEWLTAGDEAVRETHRSQNGQVVRMGQKFKNGLEYPGDMAGDPAETCNCRCTIIPVIE